MADVMPYTVIGTMLSVLNTALTEVDTVSQSEFMPPITTTGAACLAVPFSYQAIGNWETLGGSVRIVHRVQFEFWVKHVQGKAATTAETAYNLGTKAIRALIDSDGSGYELDYEAVEYAVDANPVTVNNMPWVVGTLVVGIVTTLE